MQPRLPEKGLKRLEIIGKPWPFLNFFHTAFSAWKRPKSGCVDDVYSSLVSAKEKLATIALLTVLEEGLRKFLRL